MGGKGGEHPSDRRVRGLRSPVTIIFTYFSWLGKGILRLYPDITKALDAGGIKIYPLAYASVVGFSILISAVVSISLTLYLLGFLGSLALVLLLIPVGVLVVGLYYPSAVGTGRAGSLEGEVPFAAAYISVMATGGVSPYNSMARLRQMKILPNMSKTAASIDLDVKGMGLDPVTALEKSANSVYSKDYRDLILGYATTLRAGGDVVHHLQVTTSSIFDRMATRIRAATDRATLLMEGYVSVAILFSLGLYTLFIISIALPVKLDFFSKEAFLLFAYVILPFVSFLFIYLLDLSQVRTPVTDWRPYKVFFLFSVPVGFTLTLLTILPYFFLDLQGSFTPTVRFVSDVTQRLGLAPGFEPTVGVYLTIGVSTLPVLIAHRLYGGETTAVFGGMVRFFRDLVEIRKTGLNPAHCIINLSERNYGRFSKYLKIVSNQLSWGTALSKIVSTFTLKIRDWYAQVNMHLLLDALYVGGGSAETLETVAEFGENLDSLERQKRASLRPLILIPYIGGFTFLVSSLFLLNFIGTMISTQQGLSLSAVYRLFIPPLVIHAALTGIVAGKVAEGKVSAGFKHAYLLTLATFIAIRLIPQFTLVPSVPPVR